MYRQKIIFLALVIGGLLALNGWLSLSIKEYRAVELSNLKRSIVQG